MAKTRFKVGDVVRINQGLEYELDPWPGVIVANRSSITEIQWFASNGTTFKTAGVWPDGELCLYDRGDIG